MGFRTHRRLRLVRRCVIEPEVRNVLRADDAITPPLQKPGGVHRREPVRGLLQESAHRTSAAFAPPKKLPPGCGTNRAIVSWRANSRPRCNRYVVSRAGEKSVVLYWWLVAESVITAAIRHWCASGSRWLEMMSRQPRGRAFRPCSISRAAAILTVVDTGSRRPTGHKGPVYARSPSRWRSEEHTSELQSHHDL